MYIYIHEDNIKTYTHTLSNILFRVFLLLLIETQIEYLTNKNSQMNSYYFTGKQHLTQKLTDMIVWIVLPRLQTGLFLSQDNYSVLSAEAHLPWPSASPPAPPELSWQWCHAVWHFYDPLSSDCLHAPGWTKTEETACLSLYFMGGKLNRNSFHKMPQTKHCLVTGRHRSLTHC